MSQDSIAAALERQLGLSSESGNASETAAAAARASEEEAIPTLIPAIGISAYGDPRNSEARDRDPELKEKWARLRRMPVPPNSRFR